MALKIFNALFFLAFVLSAAVQYNDPDSARWIAVYGLAAAMSVAHHWRLLPGWLPIVVLLVCLLWMITLLPAIIGQVSWQEIVASVSMKTQAVEEAREIGGLALVALWAAVVIVAGRKFKAS